MNAKDRQICSILTTVIRSNKPMLGDFAVSVTKSLNMTRPTVDVAAHRIRIPQNIKFEALLLMIGPMMDKACMQIEYDAHAINDKIDECHRVITEATDYLALYITPRK